MEITRDLPPALVPVAWLLGTWEGAGVGGYPTIESFNFGQEIVFSHVGKPVLQYSSRSWLLDDEGNRVRALASEDGFWRPMADGSVEVTMAHPTGFAEIWVGDVTSAKVEMRTDVVVRTASAKDYSAGHRLYGLVEGDLFWVFDMAAMGEPIQSHLSARLKRVA